MTLEDHWKAVEAAAPEEREDLIEAWLATQPEDLRDLMRPELYSALALLRR